MKAKYITPAIDILKICGKDSFLIGYDTNESHQSAWGNGAKGRGTEFEQSENNEEGVTYGNIWQSFYKVQIL